MINRLGSHKPEQYAYVSKLIELKHDNIKDTIQNYSLLKRDPAKAKIYDQILRIHIKLACELEPKSVLSIIEKAIKETFQPLEEYLKICLNFKQLEASALLSKKIGHYQESVKLYLDVLNK